MGHATVDEAQSQPMRAINGPFGLRENKPHQIQNCPLHDLRNVVCIAVTAAATAGVVVRFLWRKILSQQVRVRGEERSQYGRTAADAEHFE